MHNLIPHFIYEQYEAGNVNGRLQAVTLFLDISGFTAMTQSLMAHGKEGAEIVATLINQVFDPIINTVYEHGGFVTGFAGDALTIAFPQKDKRTALTACHTALTIADIFTDQGIRSTKFGDFTLAVKQGLSAGEIEWGIVGLDDHKTYFFRGQAIDGCAVAEQQAEAGDIITDERLQLLLPPQTATLTSLSNQHSRLSALSEIDVNTVPIELSVISPTTMAQFFPLEQWQTSQQGEFRDVSAVFVSFQGVPDLAAINHFISQAMILAEQFEGFFVEIDFGDKGGLFLVYFGAPVTHENDVERALNFILALQTELADVDLVWRAGITFGTVYAGYVGIPLRDKYTCMGTVVNLAARLMMQAEWGQVLVSKSVALHPGFDFISLGQLPYKGFAQPLPTYRLKGKTLAQQVFQQKMVGRESELQELLEFAQSLFDRQTVRAAIVYGEAGIGKSHLTYSLGQTLGAKVRWMIGQCDPILRQAFNPFVYFLKRYFGQAPTAVEAENKANFDHRLQDLLITLTDIPEAQRQHDELARTRSFLGALLGLYWPDSLYEQLDAKGRYENTMIAVSMLLQAECRRQPVVLELEDGQWLDEASHELLTTLIRQTKNMSLLILITSRYGDDGSRPNFIMDSATPTLAFDLTALTAVAIQQLAQEILGTPISAVLQTFLMEKTQANPFFAQQILHYLQENKLLRVETLDSQSVITLGTDDFELPTTLNTLLVARLDRLTQQVKEVVQTAAVLGREFELRLLLQMLKRDIKGEVTTAEEEQIWSLLNELQYIFKHTLLRDAAYEMQLRARLKDLHYLAATAGEQLYTDQLPAYYGALAYHYETAYLLGQEEAWELADHYLQQAGQQASANFENSIAVSYFSRALALIPIGETRTRYDLYLMRENIYNIQGNREAQQADLEELLKLANELGLVEQATVSLRQIDYAKMTSNYAQAISWAKAAVEQAHQGGDIGRAAEGYVRWGDALQQQGNYAAAQVQLQIGWQWAKESDNQLVMAGCLLNLGLIHGEQGSYTKSKEYFESALTIFHEIGALNWEMHTRNNLGMVCCAQRDYAKAIEYYERSLTTFREIGDQYGEGLILYNWGTIVSYQGNYVRAMSYYEQALSINREIGDRSGEGLTLSSLGELVGSQGNYARAIVYCEQALAIHREVGYRLGEGLCLNTLGSIALAQAHIPLAESYYQESLAIRQELSQSYHIVEDWAGLAKVKLVQRDLDSARKYGTQILDYMSEKLYLEGVVSFMRTFQFTWDVLVGLGQTADADHVLTLAAQIIEEYLDRNNDPAAQGMYLAQPHHKVLWAAWQKKQEV